jgi:hypothetical protein
MPDRCPEAFKFGMPKEQLNSARVLDATINQ